MFGIKKKVATKLHCCTVSLLLVSYWFLPISRVGLSYIQSLSSSLSLCWSLSVWGGLASFDRCVHKKHRQILQSIPLKTGVYISVLWCSITVTLQTCSLIIQLSLSGLVCYLQEVADVISLSSESIDWGFFNGNIRGLSPQLSANCLFHLYSNWNVPLVRAA